MILEVGEGSGDRTLRKDSLVFAFTIKPRFELREDRHRVILASSGHRGKVAFPWQVLIGKGFAKLSFDL